MHLVVRKVVALSQIRKFQGPVFPPLPYPLDHDRSRDKALLIGIGYNPAHHDVHALEHPHRDVDMFKDYLVEHEGYLPERVKVLKDDSKDPLLQPTRMNILMEIDELVKDVQRGDRLVFVFAGHGCQTINRTGSEPLDQAALTSNHCGYPVDDKGQPLPSRLPGDPLGNPDHQRKLNGVIIDNELRERLVNPLPAGAQLVAFLETCHSETLLDLHSRRWKKAPVPAFVSKGTKFVARGVRSATFSHALPSIQPLFPSQFRWKKKQTIPELPPTPTTPRSKSWQLPIKVTAGKKKRSGGDATVISFSACGDNESSQDLPGGHTMLSIVTDHLRSVAGSTDGSDDTEGDIVTLTPRQLAEHIRSTWNEMRAEALAPIWKDTLKRPQSAKKLKTVIRYVKNVCGIQASRVTILGGAEVIDQPLQL